MPCRNGSLSNHFTITYFGSTLGNQGYFTCPAGRQTGHVAQTVHKRGTLPGSWSTAEFDFRVLRIFPCRCSAVHEKDHVKAVKIHRGEKRTRRSLVVNCSDTSHELRGTEPVCHSSCEVSRSEEHTSELQSLAYIVCRL